ncbi:glucose-6-phosphate exchanger SLC37A2 isoform X2 [Sitodiplosis mosellana]|uniref:glucose-6-phosphate exchanger SLC37A2 isoform X2 n=1 Tax=Sitodiplosis mosellana TaxID=263140 RepID=UPI0024452D20|nr:glucose-6-phosphate exchanger SLC37A2 isoform X2 [Sitodiplosis mosellana]
MNFKRKTMSTSYLDVPIGIRLIQRYGHCENPANRLYRYKFSVLALTYVAYTCYHLTRKPISVVKAVLHRNCSLVEIPKQLSLVKDVSNESTWCDYAPFDGPDASALLGTLDTSFLLTYGVAMFASGFVAERVSLRYFLTFGMLFSAIFTYMFGIAKLYDIHSFWYFIVVQALAGMFQTTGWPGVVTVVGRWFGKSKRGLIFGIWNSHTSIGNILGSLVAGYYVERDWSMSFIMPAFVMGIVGIILFLFLVDSPEIVSCQVSRSESRRNSGHYNYHSIEDGVNESDDDVNTRNLHNENELNNVVEQEISHRPTERTPMIGHRRSSDVSFSGTSNHAAIGFGGALQIPGVVEFSLCLFFSKLVSYTFLYWLPNYIEHSTNLGAEDSAKLSTLFDFGGILGAIAAGMISDYSGMSACTCTAMLSLAVPMLLVYQKFGALTIYLNIILLFLLGILVNGPYALITTSVSAELGQHSCLDGNSKALATVTAIIDGTGSLGAAVGPFLAGFFSATSWEHVFYMLIMADVLALILLLRLVSKEISKLKMNPRID